MLLAASIAAAAPNMALGAACLENSSPGRICTANDFETVSEELISDHLAVSTARLFLGIW
ncbi:hypothetical protein GPB2148_2370 [marine gamma proteobacterium HTCC2148]|nr:hypothetical protein GPB2148_2370 [marine gamma proteobacterium HTCC2148]